ncbi:hypothetical protein [Kiloniella litopenaei]|uniref:hypothetical protein n=1 Tax=Kiloniella litopenaei TaxID=1549748 RepID=UPI0012FEF226|nr:hypothetical protein [Kiloniella litopenaei]
MKNSQDQVAAIGFDCCSQHWDESLFKRKHGLKRILGQALIAIIRSKAALANIKLYYLQAGLYLFAGLCGRLSGK